MTITSHEINTWRQRVLEAALHKLFTNDYFNICDIDNLCKTLNVPTGGSTYNELRLLHCICYRDMHQDIIAELPNKVMTILQSPLDFNADLAARLLTEKCQPKVQAPPPNPVVRVIETQNKPRGLLALFKL